MGSAIQLKRRSFQLEENGMFSLSTVVSESSDFAQDRIAELQSEVATLRRALLDTERVVALKEGLLHNMRRRELELRAELVKGWA